MVDEGDDAIRTLIIVCGHAIYVHLPGHDPDPELEQNWKLKPFQQSDNAKGKQGEHITFLGHILKGVDLGRDPTTLLVFSGGKTDPSVDLSEAQSYLDAFNAKYALDQCRATSSPGLSSRMALENFATDSYQNLLFSLLLFRKRLERYPERINIVTHDFKRARFLAHHAPAIKWAAERIVVTGIDPPWSSEEERLQTAALERRNALELFDKDPYGTHDPLHVKRTGRLWSDASLEHIGRDLETEVRELLAWRGPALFDRSLPWPS